LDVGENYIGLFISEDSLSSKASNIKVIFTESTQNESNAISQILYGQKELIMTYSSENGLREIEEVQLLNSEDEIIKYK